MKSKMTMQNSKLFSGSDSREILHYVNPSLESGNYDSAVLYFGVNDLMQKALSKSGTVEKLIENKESCRKMYVAWIIESFCIGDCAN